MISEVVEKETKRIEDIIKTKTDYILQNTDYFNKKFRGNEDLDVNLFFLDTENDGVEINLFVGDEQTKLLSKYKIVDDKLITKQKHYGNGNKRVSYTNR